MACPCTASGEGSGPMYQPLQPPAPNSCGLTRGILNNWLNTMICIKLQDKFAAANLGLQAVNQLLGVLQSALNYPDNYCYYWEQLEVFQNSILPTIVVNVPECIS